MIQVVQDNDIYKITFPYDYSIKEIVKSIPGRRWNPNGKYWSIPLNHLGMLIRAFTGTEYEDMVTIKSNEQININQELEETYEIPDINISRVKKYVKKGYSLYQHQVDFLKYAINRENNGNLNGFICCDTMGLGKTLEAINLALYNKRKYNFKHCLIICCVNMSKYNWLNEIEVQTNGEFYAYILGSRKGRKGKINYNGSSKQKLDDLQIGHMYGDKSEPKLPYFIIMNVEALRMKEEKKHPIADELINYINDFKINMCVIDEVHKNLSPQSQQGNQLLKIKKKTGTKCSWLPMTGTPIVNRPTDLFLPLRLIDAHAINSYWTWNQSFCVYGGYGGHDIIGYKNMKMLKSLLQNNMIRRTKEQVLDLPDKIEFIEYVENTKYQEKLMQEIQSDLLLHKDEIVTSLNPLAKMMRLRQVNGSPELIDESIELDKKYLTKNAKMRRFLEILEDIINRDEKVVVFSNWVEPLRTIYHYIHSKYKTCVFTGTIDEKDRQRNKETFINNPEYKIMLGTMGALGTTHTLTVANNVIFYDEPWTAADRQQAVDRVHRISTSKSVNIYTLLSKDTIDERVHKILYEKDTIAGFMVDNKIDIYNNPELFDVLLGN